MTGSADTAGLASEPRATAVGPAERLASAMMGVFRIVKPVDLRVGSSPGSCDQMSASRRY